MLRDEIVIVEDEIQQAKKFYEHLKLKDKIQSVKYLRNLGDLKELFNEKGIIRFYLVDIHLGKGKQDEGIQIIKTIRENDPDALIIVYSGYPDKEHPSIEAGADLFFEKDPVTYEDDLWQIRNLIVRERAKEESWDRIVTLYSQIVDIDRKRNLVRLSCKLKKDASETFERVFPLKHFKNGDKLVVDQPILVQIFERPGEVRYIFKEIEEDYFENDDNIDISDLTDSPIFKPIDKF
ncbi:MAG: response regulator [Candidatus Aminicenantes bacterium]|jgi:DNA-binding NarL/FixJ family response regulator